MNLLTITTAAAVLFVLGGAACLAEPQPPSSAEPPVAQPAEFDRLLKQLSSPSFIQRDWAARRLIRQGAEIVPPLVAAVRAARNETEVETTADAAIGLLGRMSRDADPLLSASSLKGLLSLQDGPQGLPETLRQRIAAAAREAVQHNLAQLTAFGAEIEWDDEQRIIQISIHSERFTDRQMPLACALASVRVLDLRGTAITGASLRNLASLANLSRLNLADTRVTGADLHQLPSLPNLRQLSLYRIEVTADDINWLRENLPPQCRVYR